MELAVERRLWLASWGCRGLQLQLRPSRKVQSTLLGADPAAGLLSHCRREWWWPLGAHNSALDHRCLHGQRDALPRAPSRNLDRGCGREGAGVFYGLEPARAAAQVGRMQHRTLLSRALAHERERGALAERMVRILRACIPRTDADLPWRLHQPSAVRTALLLMPRLPCSAPAQKGPLALPFRALPQRDGRLLPC